MSSGHKKPDCTNKHTMHLQKIIQVNIMQVSYYKALKMQDLNLDPEKGHFSLDNLEEQMDDQEML